MIIYDHKIFEDMHNNTNNNTYVIISIITVNCYSKSLLEISKIYRLISYL